MPLIVSISGIRGVFGDGLSPQVIVRYAGTLGEWCRVRSKQNRPTVVVGRDARVTGDICSRLVTATLQGHGCHVVDAGLATTPTIAMAVTKSGAAGAVILSASHNPAEWNALKLLNERGEFLSPDEALEIIEMEKRHPLTGVRYDRIGTYRTEDFLQYHVDAICDLPYIRPDVIRERNFRIVVDGINSVGAVAVPALLEALGVRRDRIDCLNCEPDGLFAHNPEPLPAHLTEIMKRVKDTAADLGIVVDPDADRLAFVQDGGEFFGEELTQVLAADFLLRIKPGPFATNLSSSRAIEDVARKYGQTVHRSAVGEINVVKKMQEVDAVLGGEGNGGVILPDLHYGRDALVGAALVLQHLAETGKSLSEIRNELPSYVISKNKVELGSLDADAILGAIAGKFDGARISTIDGVKIDFDEGWVHMRKSNTEPIIRIYSEAEENESAEALARRFIDEIERSG